MTNPQTRRQAGDRVTCRKCPAEFDLTASQAKNSDYRCAACRKAANRAHFQAHKDERREYMRDYREANPEKHARWSLARRSTPEFKEKWAKYVAENKEKKTARLAVMAAVRAGRLVRPAACACGSDLRVEAHHEDYAKPLDVEWLCRRCHRKHHPTPRVSA